MPLQPLRPHQAYWDHSANNSKLICSMPSHEVTPMVPILLIELLVDFPIFRAKLLHFYEARSENVTKWNNIG